MEAIHPAQHCVRPRMLPGVVGRLVDPRRGVANLRIADRPFEAWDARMDGDGQRLAAAHEIQRRPARRRCRGDARPEAFGSQDVGQNELRALDWTERARDDQIAAALQCG